MIIFSGCRGRHPLQNAKNRWEITNVDPDEEIENLMNLINNAILMHTGREVLPSDPLYPETLGRMFSCYDTLLDYRIFYIIAQFSGKFNRHMLSQSARFSDSRLPGCSRCPCQGSGGFHRDRRTRTRCSGCRFREHGRSSPD